MKNIMDQTYNQDSIKVLGDIEHIRLRKGMYIGEAEDPRSLISEIFDNAIDEVQGGFSDKLVINVDTKNNVYSVRDYGRGIPHGTKVLENGEEKEILEVLITKANSGGKFDNSSYIYASGLHGVGVTVTNALSDWIDVTSYRDDKYVSVHSEHGNHTIVKKGNTDEPNGTEFVFKPDKTMFRNEKIPISFITSRCRVASALGFKSELFVDGSQVDTASTIYDLMKDEDSSISQYVATPIFHVTNKEKEAMKVAIKYTSDTSDKYFGYSNMLVNSLGGTHVQVLGKTIQDAWIDFVASHKNIKPTVELRKGDYLIGLRAVCAVFIAHPEFSSQTKEKLVVSKNYFDELMSNFKKEFINYLEDNILIAKQLLKRFEEYRIAQNALLSRKEISSLIKINTDDSDNIRRRSVVSKLIECTSKKRKGTELFICEGDSAAGPYQFVRDKVTQAVLPIRGKILNTTFKDLKEIIKNKEICDIANSIGCGIGANCDASKSRYDRIIISADADPDGSHISCLVLAVFVNTFPDMVKEGRVYISIPPLYCWGTSSNNYGWCNKVEDIPKSAKDVHRFKGLGEMNNDQLYYFLVDPKTRNLLQVQYPTDIDEFNYIMGTSEGKHDLLKELGVIQ